MHPLGPDSLKGRRKTGDVLDLKGSYPGARRAIAGELKGGARLESRIGIQQELLGDVLEKRSLSDAEIEDLSDAEDGDPSLWEDNTEILSMDTDEFLRRTRHLGD